VLVVRPADLASRFRSLQRARRFKVAGLYWFSAS